MRARRRLGPRRPAKELPNRWRCLLCPTDWREGEPADWREHYRRLHQ